MLSGAIWQSMDRLGLQGFNFILQIILARLLLSADFGIVVLLDVFIQIAWCFIDSGLGASMVQCQEAECGWPRKLDNLTWCKMPVKLT